MNDTLKPYKDFGNVKRKAGGIVEFKDINRVFRTRKRGTPRFDNLFMTILILKGYFIWQVKRPCWELMADKLESPYDDYTYDSLENLWSKWKKRFLEKYPMRINEVEYAKWIYSQYQRQKEYLNERA